MPTTLPDIILLDAKSGTGAGDAVGVGERIRYANGAGRNQNKWATRFKARIQLKDSTTGASATVAIQGSDDNSSFTTIKAFTLAVGTGDPNQVAKTGLIVANYKWFRANVTAVAGGSAPVVNSYMTFGSFGQ